MTEYYKTKKYKGYDSMFEYHVANELQMRVMAGELKLVEEQVSLPLVVFGKKVCNYKIDFVAHRTDGKIEYIEAKGYATDVFKMKWKLFVALYSQERKDAYFVIMWQGKQTKFENTLTGYPK